MEVQDLLDEIIAFRDERDWEQFHTPQQLAAALSIEVAELQELFLWKEPDEVTTALEQGNLQVDVEREIADILIYALLFCESIESSPDKLIIKKLAENRNKYPVDKFKGKAYKYNWRGRDDID